MEDKTDDPMEALVQDIGAMSDVDIAVLIRSLKDERAADHMVRQEALAVIDDYKDRMCRACDHPHSCEACAAHLFCERMSDVLSFKSDLYVVQELIELRNRGGLQHLVDRVIQLDGRRRFLQEQLDRMEDELALMSSERVEFPNGWPRRTDGTMLLIGDKVKPDENWNPMTVTGVELYDDHFCLRLDGHFVYRYEKGREVEIPEGQHADMDGNPLSRGDCVMLPNGQTAVIEFLAASMDYGYKRAFYAFARTKSSFDLACMRCSELRKVADDDEEA